MASEMLPDRRLDRTWQHIDVAADGSAWAVLTMPVYPGVAEHNPAVVRWRSMAVDPDLIGLASGRARPAEIVIGNHKSDAGWTLPVPDVLFSKLVWHPRLPLVAGIAIRDQRAFPWVANHAARTVTVLEHVRVASGFALQGSRFQAPLGWCGDESLVLLVPSPELRPTSTRRNRMPVVYEATGPGFVSFESAVRELAELAAAAPAVVDLVTGQQALLGPPALIRSVNPSPTGRFVLVEYADRDGRTPDADGLCWTDVVLDTMLPGNSVPVGRGGRWAGGDADVLTWRRPAESGTTVHFLDLAVEDVAEQRLLAEHRPSELTGCWPIWDRGEPVLLSHCARTLTLSTANSSRVLHLPAGPLRLGRQLPVPGLRVGRAVLDCRDAAGQPGLVVVSLGDSSASVIWAPDAEAATVRGTWPVDDGHSSGLMVRAGLRLVRYTLTRDGFLSSPTVALAGTDTAFRLSTPAGRSVSIATGFGHAWLTCPAAAEGRSGPPPLVLWLRAADPNGPAASPSAADPERRGLGAGHPPAVLAATGYLVATLDLALHWPGDAQLAMLHAQIVEAVRGALTFLADEYPHAVDGGVVIAGHSFCATLALYALAHIPELATAIVHSGCYNRTLTPTGFQYERRSYWSVPAIYHAFSALHFADRLDRPVLIVHGVDDANPATTPDQAVALYQGIVATGGHARLLLLPHEGHSFGYLETQQTLVDEHRRWIGLHARTLRSC
ncbi:MAG: alpha/beta hydrolase family protein [Pseudonocardiales bacterium]